MTGCLSSGNSMGMVFKMHSGKCSGIGRTVLMKQTWKGACMTCNTFSMFTAGVSYPDPEEAGERAEKGGGFGERVYTC